MNLNILNIMSMFTKQIQLVFTCKNFSGQTPWRLSPERIITIPSISSPIWITIWSLKSISPLSPSDTCRLCVTYNQITIIIWHLLLLDWIDCIYYVYTYLLEYRNGIKILEFSQINNLLIGNRYTNTKRVIDYMVYTRNLEQ